VILLSLLLCAGSGCQSQIKQEYETLKDLRPFVPRSPAARQKKIDETYAINDLIAALADKNPGIVMRAVEALGQTGDERAAVPLIGMLNRSDPSLRFVTSEALIHLGSAAVPSLIDTLNHKDPVVVSAAAEILGKIGDQRAIEPLTEALKHRDSDRVRLSVATALGAIGGKEVVVPLIRLLKNKDSVVQYAAAEALAVIGQPAVPFLIDELKNTDPDIVLIAINTLGKTGEQQAVQPLIDLLHNDLPDAVRMSVVKALGRLKDPRAVPVLMDRLTDRVSVVRGLAAEALVDMGTAGIDPLVEILGNNDPEIQDLASDALVKIGAPAVEPLLEKLSENDPKFSWPIIDILGRIGDERAVTPLIEKLQSPDPDIAMKAADALGVIGNESAVEPLILVLKDHRSPARHAAADALIRIGEPAIQPLIMALSATDAETRNLVSDALVKIGRPAVDPLAAEMLSPDADFRKRVAKILVGIGTPAVGPLGAVLADKNPHVRRSAADALVNIGNSAAVQALVDDLSLWHARKTAAKALESLEWKPANPSERIYYLIAKGRKAELLADWDTTRYVLLKKLRSGSKQANRYAISAIIELGETKLIPKLLNFLDTHGNGEMAGIYLNSGRKELVEAARDWMARHKEAKVTDSAVAMVRWDAMGASSP